MEVTVAEMKKIESNANENGLSYTQMMENAGTGASELLKKEGSYEKVAVFCGSGNNGGDGFVLARSQSEAGKNVQIILVEREPKTEDSILNYKKAKALNIPIYNVDSLSEDEIALIKASDFLVDAIYGTGFHGELRPNGKRAAEIINSAKGRVLALDLPSGVEADSGRAAAGAVKADFTVSFHAFKPCHRLNPEFCGKTYIVSIGTENI